MARDFIFMHRLTEVQILDEGSRSFICVVARTSNEAFLRRDWTTFCAANHLRGGSKLLFGINMFDPGAFMQRCFSVESLEG